MELVPRETDWKGTFAGGNRTVQGAPGSFTSHVGLPVSATTDVIQSFRGNGQTLAGLGFFATPGEADWTVWILDYGQNPDRIDISTEFQSRGRQDAVLRETFATAAAAEGRQLYLDFGGEANIVLAADRYYAIVFETTAAGFLDRSANDVYPDGAARQGVLGESSGTWNALGGAPRSLNFALYTADGPIQEDDYAVWASSLPESDRAPGADPDGDGFANLLAYALGATPGQSLALEALPQATVTLDGGLRFGFLTPSTPRPDLLYAIESSTDALTWSSLATRDPDGPWPETVVATQEAGGLRIEFPLSPAADGGRLLRLRVEIPAAPL
jgi:hypothetical protein